MKWYPISKRLIRLTLMKLSYGEHAMFDLNSFDSIRETYIGDS